MAVGVPKSLKSQLPSSPNFAGAMDPLGAMYFTGAQSFLGVLVAVEHNMLELKAALQSKCDLEFKTYWSSKGPWSSKVPWSSNVPGAESYRYPHASDANYAFPTIKRDPILL